MHTFQKSLEAVLQRLGEVEIGQKTLENAGNIAGTENEILLFRNQLKVSKLQSWTKTLKNSIYKSSFYTKSKEYPIYIIDTKCKFKSTSKNGGRY